jgi:hypothetical protein
VITWFRWKGQTGFAYEWNFIEYEELPVFVARLSEHLIDVCGPLAPTNLTTSAGGKSVD